MPGCWSYLAISAVLQVVYAIFLAYAYRHGELSQIYPVIRGSVPLLVTLGGFLLAAPSLSRLGLIKRDELSGRYEPGPLSLVFVTRRSSETCAIVVRAAMAMIGPKLRAVLR